MVTDWETGFGAYKWVIWKNVIIVVFGLFALVFGSISAVKDILNQLGGGGAVEGAQD